MTVHDPSVCVSYVIVQVHCYNVTNVVTKIELSILLSPFQHEPSRRNATLENTRRKNSILPHCNPDCHISYDLCISNT